MEDGRGAPSVVKLERGTRVICNDTKTCYPRNRSEKKQNPSQINRTFEENDSLALFSQNFF